MKENEREQANKLTRPFVLKGKRDERPKRGYWAPGQCLRMCIRCSHHFMGDKRAEMCAVCAYKDDA